MHLRLGDLLLFTTITHWHAGAGHLSPCDMLPKGVNLAMHWYSDVTVTDFATHYKLEMNKELVELVQKNTDRIGVNVAFAELNSVKAGDDAVALAKGKLFHQHL